MLSAKFQGGASKAAEPLFSALYKRYQILYRPCRLSSKAAMNLVAEMYFKLHNVTTRDRVQRSKYKGTQVTRLPQEALPAPTSAHLLAFPDRDDAQTQVVYWSDRVGSLETPVECLDLKELLANHLWNLAGWRRLY